MLAKARRTIKPAELETIYYIRDTYWATAQDFMEDMGPNYLFERCAFISTGSGHAALTALESASCNTMTAAFSPIIIDGALVLPEVKVGMIEASATRNP